jgi:hypothetical protein
VRVARCVALTRDVAGAEHGGRRAGRGRGRLPGAAVGTSGHVGPPQPGALTFCHFCAMRVRVSCARVRALRRR